MALVYIVEDDESIGALIEATLSAATHEARLFPDAAQMEAALSEAVPELLLLDIMLPGKSGWEVLEEWVAREATKNAPVIVLSARGGELDKVRGLEMGATDYVTKPFGVLELQSRVKAALRRAPEAACDVYEVGDIRVDLGAKEVLRLGERVSLTRKELELLEYMCRNAGLTLSREMLLDSVWYGRYGAESTRTVDYHIKSLRRKLGDSAEDARYIETVRGFGYRLRRE